jgi:hypothetical protein
MLASGWTTGRATRLAMSMAWLLGAACGDDDGSGGDGAGAADAAADAAAADAATDAEPGSGPSAGRFIISTFTIAGNFESASDLGLDIDGDGFTENGLGSEMASIAETVEIDPEVVFVQGVASGAIIQLLALDAGAEGQGTLRGFIGQDLDADPGDNVSGDEPFAIDDGAPTDTPLPAEDGFNGVTAGPGEIPLRLPLAAPFSGVVTARLLGARVDAERQKDGSIAGRLGGGFLASDLDILLVPLVADGLNDVVARDCPTGPGSCEEGSAGDSLLSFVDRDQDGIITADEVRDSGIFQGTTLGADLDLLDADGDYAPNQDGVYESLSWGMGFATTGAAFDLP